jgi:hypothetical protein
LQVPTDIRLDRLHLTIQAAMGWTNSHLYMFKAGGTTWGMPDPDFGGDDRPANKTTLAELIEETGAGTINYLYDFGDSWDHKISIGKIRDPIAGELYPCLTDIAGRCPPEDVGGLPGYEEFLLAIVDPKHPEHADLKRWYGGDFDPNMPNSGELRLNVLKLAKRWKPKKKRLN